MNIPRNLHHDLPPDRGEEEFETLLESQGVKIERITSRGEATPEGEWLSQPRGEWVAVLEGEGTLRFEGDDAPVRLAPGDWIWIAPGARHRVESTRREPPTLWLAVHLPEPRPEPPPA